MGSDIANSADIRTWRADWIVPMSAPPIENGYLSVDAGGTIVEISRQRPTTFYDLGQVALLPGWVNAHTHLELSDFVLPVGQRGIPLAEWILQVIASRMSVGRNAENAIAKGLAESRQRGVQLIADIAQLQDRAPSEAGTPRPPASEFFHWPPKLISCFEVLGLQAQRPRDTLAGITRQFERQPMSAGSGLQVIAQEFGLSPHAPYSTLPETVAACVRLSSQHRRLLAMHLAETPEEEVLTRQGTGPFADALKTLGVWAEGLFPNGIQNLDWLSLLSGAHRALIVHGNYLDAKSLEFLGCNPQLSVVYCPRTHDFFQHTRHPVNDMLLRNVRVCLGTDSRASNPDLDLGGEVKWLLLNRPDIAPQSVFEMGTIHGADALGKARYGRIAIGCTPGINVLPLSKVPPGITWESLAENFLEHGTMPLVDAAASRQMYMG